MEQTILAVLDAAVSAPAAWGALRPGTVLPYISLQLVGGDADRLLSQPAGLKTATVQVDCHAASYGGAATLAAEVESAIGGYQAGVIRGVLLQGFRDLDPKAGGEAELGFTRSLDFTVIWS